MKLKPLPDGAPRPIGTLFLSIFTPNGCLRCDGSSVSRSTFKELFAVIGELFGEGDGETTFTLPNLTDSSGIRKWHILAKPKALNPQSKELL